AADTPTPAEVLDGVRSFFAKTARPDGPFRPGVDPDYAGISDSAYSDLAPVTYAVVLHKPFGWKLPHEETPRALLLARQHQADDGYLNDHIAATFHAVHYSRLLGAPTPKAGPMLARVLRDQKPDGSWLLNPPARDRHATFDACFVLRQLGRDRADCRRALGR